MEKETKIGIIIGITIGTIMLWYLFGDMIVDWLFHKLLA